MQEARDYLDRLEAPAARPTGGGRFAWRVWGDGAPDSAPTVLLLHGAFGSWRHWARVIAPLAPRVRLLVPDMTGFGDAPDPGPDWSETALARDLAAELEILGVTRVHALAGFSFGGIVAGHLAALLGERLSHLLLVGPNGLGLAFNTVDNVRGLDGARHLDDIAAVHRHNLGRIMLHRPESANDLAVLIQMENAGRSRARTRGIPESDSLARVLPAIRARITGLWGERDAFADGLIDQREELLRRHQPDLRFLRVPEAGHWVPFEAPEITVKTLLGLAVAEAV